MAQRKTRQKALKRDTHALSEKNDIHSTTPLKSLLKVKHDASHLDLCKSLVNMDSAPKKRVRLCCENVSQSELVSSELIRDTSLTSTRSTSVHSDTAGDIAACVIDYSPLLSHLKNATNYKG